MAKNVLEILLDKIEESKKTYSEAILDGNIKDFAEYKHLCGVIRGLATAQLETEDLLRKTKENDED